MGIKDKEKRREYNKKYWAAHSSIIKERRAEKRTQRTAYQQSWYENNRDKWNTYQREYRKRRKEANEKDQRRSA